MFMQKCLEGQYKLLSIITKSPHYSNGNYLKLSRVIAKEASKFIKVKRVGIWLLTDQKIDFRCTALYHNSKYQPLASIAIKDCPKYFSSFKIKKTLVVSDVCKAKETQELYEDYFRPNKVTSFLGSVIEDGKNIIGMICLEHIGPKRKWGGDEINLSGILGRILGTAYILNKRAETEKELLATKEHLTESNMTLKNVLERFEAEKKSYSENVALNIEKNIIPILNKLKEDPLSIDRHIIKRLEIGISSLSSSFYKKLVKVSYNLTPTEIKICQMIKSGYLGKEIAGMLNLSFVTVETHKKNIRKKLDITGRSVNFRVYLNEIEGY